MKIVFRYSLVQNKEDQIKRVYCCPKCAAPLTDRVSRGLLVKVLLPWLPLKKYICYKCMASRYVFGRPNSYKRSDENKAQYALHFQK
jgi:hypothetical protein